jgi:hypothetical protein
MNILTKIVIVATVVYLLLQVGRFWGHQEMKVQAAYDKEYKCLQAY